MSNGRFGGGNGICDPIRTKRRLPPTKATFTAPTLVPNTCPSFICSGSGATYQLLAHLCVLMRY